MTKCTTPLRIEKVEIEKFRGFKQESLLLGEHITAISGQNGAQKSTLLGIISQTFTVPDYINKEDVPLTGTSFKSQFGEKFKLSPTFDKAGEHQWTIYLPNHDPFVVESIVRDKKANTLRFWQKGKRAKGDGYFKHPVLYLGLRRLISIGEDSLSKESPNMELSNEEIIWFKKWHAQILVSNHDQANTVTTLKSRNLNVVGVNTDYYDWRQNSAGQSNLSRILLAILSLIRLQKKYPSDYKGSLLVIDEIDATLYPGSQKELIKALISLSKKHLIQVVFTTHSLTILKQIAELVEDKSQSIYTENLYRSLFLKKIDQSICIEDNANFQRISQNLNVEMAAAPIRAPKVHLYTEDSEAKLFVQLMLKQVWFRKLRYIDVTFPCTILVDLCAKNLPAFSEPEGIVVLDGDVRRPENKKMYNKIAKRRNVFLLPGVDSPEAELANFLFSKPDSSSVWDESVNFTKQLVFKGCSPADIASDREKAKEWFNSLKVQVGTRIFHNAIRNMFQTKYKNECEKIAEKMEALIGEIELKRITN